MVSHNGCQTRFGVKGKPDGGPFWGFSIETHAHDFPFAHNNPPPPLWMWIEIPPRKSFGFLQKKGKVLLLSQEWIRVSWERFLFPSCSQPTF